MSINLEDSPLRSTLRSPTKSTDLPTRPKSAMRFLAAPAYLITASPAAELKSVDAVEYFSKCEGYIGGMSAFVSRIESKLNQVKRDNIVNIEAARSEVRRLMQELDRERWTTKKLSLDVDQKNQKILELTQALKTEQVHKILHVVSSWIKKPSRHEQVHTRDPPAHTRPPPEKSTTRKSAHLAPRILSSCHFRFRSLYMSAPSLCVFCMPTGCTEKAREREREREREVY